MSSPIRGRGTCRSSADQSPQVRHLQGQAGRCIPSWSWQPRLCRESGCTHSRKVFRLALGACSLHFPEHGAAVHALQVRP